MYQINDLKVGVTFEMDGDLYQVLYSEHSKTGRAGAVMRTKIKNLISGATLEKTFKSSDKFIPAKLDRRECQFLYKDGNVYFFMNNQTYDQFSLSKSDVSESINYIKENENVTVLSFNEKPIGIDLPPKVNLKVIEAENAVKGDTQSSVTKPVKVETGYTLNVPIFVKEGDTIKINTQTGEYVERV